MSDTMTLSEYETEVDSIAEEAKREAREQGFDREGLDDWVWETVDGHQWVIYTHFNYQVLQHSRNDSYTIDNFGADSATDGHSLNTAALAFGALYADERLADFDPEDDDGEDA